MKIHEGIGGFTVNQEEYLKNAKIKLNSLYGRFGVIEKTQLKATATNLDTMESINVVGNYNSKQELVKELEENGYHSTLNDIKEI